jgi:hypothetical protein
MQQGILVVNMYAKCGSIVDVWGVCSMVVFVHGMMSKQQHQGYTMHGHFYGSYVVKLSISAAAGK